MGRVDESPEVPVGVSELEQEHRQLFSLINEIHGGVAKAKGEAFLRPILARLAESALVHFAHEELLLEQHGYAGLAAHKLQHEALTHRVAAVQKAFEAGDGWISAEVDELMAAWLAHHIGEIDNVYEPILHGQKVGG